MACQNCGAYFSPDGSPDGPLHCGNCPPWKCEDCGQMSSATELCRCWISLEDIPLADIKGLLAMGGLSVDPHIEGAKP